MAKVEIMAEVERTVSCVTAVGPSRARSAITYSSFSSQTRWRSPRSPRIPELKMPRRARSMRSVPVPHSKYKVRTGSGEMDDMSALLCTGIVHPRRTSSMFGQIRNPKLAQLKRRDTIGNYLTQQSSLRPSARQHATIGDPHDAHNVSRRIPTPEPSTARQHATIGDPHDSRNASRRIPTPEPTSSSSPPSPSPSPTDNDNTSTATNTKCALSTSPLVSGTPTRVHFRDQCLEQPPPGLTTSPRPDSRLVLVGPPDKLGPRYYPAAMVQFYGRDLTVPRSDGGGDLTARSADRTDLTARPERTDLTARSDGRHLTTPC